MAKLADDTAKQAAVTAAIAACALPPLTNAINRSLKMLQITTSELQSYSTAIQSHSQAILDVCQEVVGVRGSLQDVQTNFEDLQQHISMLMTPSMSTVPVMRPGNPSLIHQQPPTNVTSSTKHSHGNNGHQNNHSTGSCIAPIIIQDSLSMAPVQCPPLSDVPSQSVIFTVSHLDQDVVEASRHVAGAIPGVGMEAIAEVSYMTVHGSALVRFRSQSAVMAFVQLLHHHDAVTQLGASTGFALFTLSPQQISPVNNALNNVHDILSNPVPQGKLVWAMPLVTLPTVPLPISFPKSPWAPCCHSAIQNEVSVSNCTLAIMAWNIHGELSLMLHGPDIELLCDYDIILLQKMWLGCEEHHTLPVPDGYAIVSLPRPKSLTMESACGGVCVIYCKDVPMTMCQELSCSKCMVLDFEDLTIILSYLPP